MDFELRRDKHAIAEFGAVIQLFQPVSAATFSRVVERLRARAKALNLPAAMPIQMLQINIGPVSGATNVPGDVGFQRFASNGEVEESLRCGPQAILYTTRDYQSWANTKRTLMEALVPLMKIYAKEVPAISSIVLQYNNAFRAKSENVVSSSEIFHSPSPWIPPFATSVDGDWHSNVGKYTAEVGDMRSLVNVNCSTVRQVVEPGEEPRLYVTALILATSSFNVPGRSPLVVDASAPTAPLSRFLEAAHTLEKSVLSEIVSKPYLEAMGAAHVD